MKKNVLLNLCLLMLTVHVYAIDGVRQDIGGVCSLSFPAPPHVDARPGIRIYKYLTDSCGYMVQVKALGAKDLARATAALPSFYDGVVKGVILGFHGSEIGHKMLSLDSMPGAEVEYTEGGQDHNPGSVSTRILLLGDRLVVYSFLAPYSRSGQMKKARDEFFGSLSIHYTPGQPLDSLGPEAGNYTDSASAPAPPTAVHTDLVRPNTLYFVVSFAGSIILLAGLLYIVVRWRKKKAQG